MAGGNTAEGTAAVVSAVVAYMLAEGMIDAAAAKSAADAADAIASAAAAAVGSIRSAETDKNADAAKAD
jgi:coenzyme F420-reducing hydrogenase beta subunit